MRIAFFLLALLCPSLVRANWTLGAFRELATLPGEAVAFEAELHSGSRQATLSGVLFSSRTATFRVIDNPPSARRSLADAITSSGALAGANASYFHPDFTPLGLTIASGKKIHDFEKARLLSGLLLVRDGRLQLTRASAYKPAPYTDAIQAGPWLVENRRPVPGLNAQKLARRTLVATDGEGHWALLATSPLSLAETASLLAVPDLFRRWSVAQALNLDGGSSTALYIPGADRPILDIPSFGPVRNYLAIVPRPR